MIADHEKGSAQLGVTKEHSLIIPCQWYWEKYRKQTGEGRENWGLEENDKVFMIFIAFNFSYLSENF